jgi:predicted RNA-binding Zn-ribbon protein involved in translation (DUF1610 family)
MSNKVINVRVNTTHAYIQGRNGMYDIGELVIWGESNPDNNTSAFYIDGVSKYRKQAVNGGFGSLTAEELDELCSKWLAARRLENDKTIEPLHCPKCGSYEVDWGRMDDAGGEYYRNNLCNKCGFRFTEEWVFDKWEADGE